MNDSQGTYCAYCGADFPIDGNEATDAITKHIYSCDQHPLTIIVRQRDRLLKAAQRAIPLINAVRIDTDMVANGVKGGLPDWLHKSASEYREAWAELEYAIRQATEQGES